MQKKSQSLFTFENIVSPKTPIELLGYAVITVLMGALSAGKLIGIIGVIAVALIWWWLSRRRIRQISKNFTGDLIFPPEKVAPNPSEGLILLLSPYSPQKKELKDEQLIRPLLDKILQTSWDKLEQADFAAIDLFNSNLVPQLKAIAYHRKQNTLKDIWLISSQTDETGQGSETTAIILEKYLKFQYQDEFLNIHSQELTIPDGDYNALWNLAEKIFRDAAYKDERIVADITGGTKMMSVALAMACLPPKRKMQYMDSKRDWQGQPLAKGDIKPVVIDVDPTLYGDSVT